jgi:hypothetical protein
MKTLYILAALAFAGCAANPGIVPDGLGKYQLQRSGYGLGETQSNVTAKLLKEASAHCAAQGKQMVKLTSDSRPGWPGHFPEAELTFACEAV